MRAVSPEERLLLRASVGTGPDAIADWRAWAAAVDFDGLMGESVRLVPLLYRNLGRLGIARAETLRYGSLYKHTWAANRLVFCAGAGAAACLAAAGIETILLKGTALALLHYKDVGVRSMADLDLLVPWARAAEAHRVLEQHGWQRMPISARELLTANGAAYTDPDGRTIDLHWFTNQDAHTPHADDVFWRAAIPVELEGVRTLALAPTDLLYSVLVHAFWSKTPHLRWAVDAATILAGGQVDWERFTQLARTRRMVPAIVPLLAWVRAELGALVPEHALASLAAVPVAWVDRLEFEDRIADHSYTARKVLLRLWTTHRRSSTASGVAVAFGLSDFLERYYEARIPQDLPALALRGLRRLRREGL